MKLSIYNLSIISSYLKFITDCIAFNKDLPKLHFHDGRVPIMDMGLVVLNYYFKFYFGILNLKNYEITVDFLT